MPPAYRGSCAVSRAVAHEDAFMTVGYLADKLEGEFSRYIEYFQPALINGLKNIEEHAVCTVAIGVIGDLCRALGKALLPFCDDIVRHLLHLLQSPALNRYWLSSMLGMRNIV